MEPKKPVQGELQSKTVILPDDEKAANVLKDLSQKATSPISSRKSLDWLTIAIIALLILVVIEVLWIFLH